jgi:hypothetical protein
MKSKTYDKTVDLEISPMPLSEEDRNEISSIIEEFKKTGEIPKHIGKKVRRKLKSNVVKVRQKSVYQQV